MAIEQEVIFRIGKTPKGCKVTKLDGTGLAEGVYTKPYQRYFYASDAEVAEQKAERYAEKKAKKLDSDVRIVSLGERM